MKKSILFVVPMLALSAVNLAACGDTPVTPGPSGDRVKIRVDSSFGKAFQETLQRFADEFTAKDENKNIEIEINQISGSYPQVLTTEKNDIQVENDEWGDLVLCYPDHVVDYLEYRKAVNFDKFLNSTDPSIALSAETRNDLTASAQSYFDVQYPRTGTYAMPFAMSSECMFYNPVLTTLTVPGINGGQRITKEYINSLTWEELFDNFCPKILAYNASLPEADQFLVTSDDYCVLGYDEDGNAFITLAEQYGYGYTSLDEDRYASLDFNNENMRNLMKKWNGYKNNHYVLSMGSYNDKRTSALFGARKALMCIGSTGGITYQQQAVTTGGGNFEIECAKIPQAAGQKDKLIMQGGSFCILSHNSADNEARQLAAWKFYKYMIEADNCTIWSAQTGYAPIRNSVYASEDWAEVCDETGKSAIELLTARNAAYVQTITDYMFTSPVFKGSAAARTYVDGLFGEILTADTATCTDAWVKSKFDAAENNIKNAM